MPPVELTLTDWYAFAPLIAVGVASLLALMAGVLPGGGGRLPGIVALVGLAVSLGFVVALWGEDRPAFAGALRTDGFALAFDAIFIASAAAGVVLSFGRTSGDRGEFTCLLMASTLGMMLVAGADNLIILFIGIELLSIPLYILSAIDVGRPAGLEAGLKYLVIGAVGTGCLLYGMALVYGATAATDFPAISAALATGDGSLSGDALLLAGVALMLVGLAFKASAAPFHLWTPDVYQGAPSAVVTFMSTATKAAAFAGFGRLFIDALGPARDQWEVLVAAVAIASMVIGNVGALTQTSVKRMMGYSGVAHAGYALIAVAAARGDLRADAQQALVVYFAAYALMNIAAFAVITAVERRAGTDQIGAFSGLGLESPVLGVSLTLALLSLSGFPPLIGFIGKLAVFQVGWEAGLGYLVVIGVLGSLVSMGYYLRLIATLYFVPAAGGAPDPSPATSSVLRLSRSALAIGAIGAAGVLAFGVLPGPILDAARTAGEAIAGR